ncbi:MAG TPA: hypothetical protein VNG33_10845 [Polyangiaceae bacterium]|nr:hypothetical protein [Polyangiaceae bacterium]
MKSSSARDLSGALCVAVAIAGIMHVRAPLAATFRKLETQTDVYALPPPDQAYVASLGYRAAFADLIFGHVLVSYGLHFVDKRRFEFVGDYLDTIVRLDPKFRDPYRYADTLLTLQPKPPTEDDYRRARKIQEQGLRELPYDQELWNTSGQFLAYLAPSYLSDPEEKVEFRRSGAQKLMRACELIGSNDSVPYHCITAATLLSEPGDREARRQLLERLASTSDDPKIQEIAQSNLRRLSGALAADRSAARTASFKAAWRGDLPFVPLDGILALGPKFDPAACAGLAVAGQAGCEVSWLSWSAAAESSFAP